VGYFVAYVTEGQGKPIDGDQVASGLGWLAWTNWAIELGKGFPNTARLAEDGELYPAEALGALEKELKRLGTVKPGDPAEDAQHVSEQLLAVVKDRPKGCIAIIITDGSDDEDDEEE